MVTYWSCNYDLTELVISILSFLPFPLLTRWIIRKFLEKAQVTLCFFHQLTEWIFLCIICSFFTEKVIKNYCLTQGCVKLGNLLPLSLGHSSFLSNSSYQFTSARTVFLLPVKGWSWDHIVAQLRQNNSQTSYSLLQERLFAETFRLGASVFVNFLKN